MKTKSHSFTWLFLALFIFSFSSQLFAQNSTLTINFGVPKIDGDTTDWEGYEWQPFLYPNGVYSYSDLTPEFKMSWDRNKIYILLKVIDQTINTENNDAWMRDGIEFACHFPDISSVKLIIWCGATLDDLIASAHSGIDNDNSTGIEVATDTLDNGYILEFGIPYETFIYTTSSFEPSDGSKFTMEIWVNDSDDGTDRDRTSWADCSSINYNQNEYDTILLSAITNPKDIIVEGGTASIDGSFADWNGLPKQLIQNPVSGTVNSIQDLSGTLRAKWDSENLYLFVAAFDSTEDYHAESSLAWNNRDAIHIALNLEGDTIYDIEGTDDDEALFVIPYNADQAMIESFSKKVDAWTGFEFAIDTAYDIFDVEDNTYLQGYALECKIPFANIWPSFNAANGTVFDMEVNIVDNDNGLDQQTALIAWSGLTDIMNDLDGFGRITLDGAITNISNSLQNEIFAYPVPATTLLHIDGKFESIELYSITGQKVLQYKGYNSNKNTIDVSTLPSGMYLLNAIYNNTRMTQKVLVSE